MTRVPALGTHPSAVVGIHKVVRLHAEEQRGRMHVRASPAGKLAFLADLPKLLANMLRFEVK